ncbi:MAG: hypothetical protein H6500_00390 [Candidatus Woesearchaeota archaeon]|nr:hypothetical protein [Nanoarchaeota archaeon]USN44292.1 MAG: hypothetical protein H6500_00390 [Candidatus Woesearchaeota archaeon]
MGMVGGKGAEVTYLLFVLVAILVTGLSAITFIILNLSFLNAFSSELTEPEMTSFLNRLEVINIEAVGVEDGKIDPGDTIIILARVVSESSKVKLGDLSIQLRTKSGEVQWLQFSENSSFDSYHFGIRYLTKGSAFCDGYVMPADTVELSFQYLGSAPIREGEKLSLMLSTSRKYQENFELRTPDTMMAKNVGLLFG